jgi:hypothetical protein
LRLINWIALRGERTNFAARNCWSSRFSVLAMRLEDTLKRELQHLFTASAAHKKGRLAAGQNNEPARDWAWMTKGQAGQEPAQAKSNGHPAAIV